MRFNSGWRMLPTEEAIYRRLDAKEREVFLEEGTSAVKLTQAEMDALGQEWEAECDVLHEMYCEQQLAEFLRD